ncbi:enoyl-CoA hydratase [Erythrobacter sp.]|nr:enoyl-CoA hydratase [Erythrobacter sp.]QIQ86871.1 MAG: enoyl-CoA hydratase [Erythrobacter sp.]
MFNADTSRNLFAAAVSLGISAILFAYAIVPASPSLIA